MATQRSAGLLLYRVVDGAMQVLLVHMGGPYWAKKDERAWSIPKGEYDDGEDALEVARREFEEELGRPAPVCELRPLGEVRQRSGKVVNAWAGEADFDASAITSNLFTIEWPPRSGRMMEFPEVDRAGWFDLPTAREKLVAGQVALLDALVASLGTT